MKAFAFVGIAVFVIVSAASAQPNPCSPARGPEPIDVPGPMPSKSAKGMRITYWIGGLRRSDLIACAEVDGVLLTILNATRRRAEGDGSRKPYPWENYFDQYTDLRWKWVGSARSGGRDVAPGGIGDLTVRWENRFDRYARRHDIESWLAANFAKGAKVNLAETASGPFETIVVRDGWDVHGQVEREFRETAQTTIRNALNAEFRKERPDRQFVAKLESLSSNLQTYSAAATGGVVKEIFSDQRLRDAIPQR